MSKRKVRKIDNYFNKTEPSSKRIKIEPIIEENSLNEPQQSTTTTTVKARVKCDPERNLLFIIPDSDNTKRIKVKREKTDLQCNTCEKIFRTKCQLKLHSNKKNCSKLGFECNKCKRKFLLRSIYEKHHCNTECKYCSKKLKTKEILFAHMKKIHPKEINHQLLECDLCKVKFTYKFQLVKHMNEIHLKRQKFTCDIDGKVFYNKNKIICHMQSHFMTISCNICNSKLKPYKLENHIKTVHSKELKFECKVCEKKFKSRIILTSHMKIHEKSFQCSICDKKFSKRPYLVDHLNSHENQRLFKCNICESTFNIKVSLKKHMIIHDKEAAKRHKCTQCNYSTYAFKNLTSHLKCHKYQDERIKSMKDPLKCEKCDKYLKNAISLKTHMHNVHSEKEYQCDLCGKIIKRKLSLNYHFRQIHLKSC